MSEVVNVKVGGENQDVAIERETGHKAAKDAAKLRMKHKLGKGEKPAETVVREWRERRQL